MESPTIKPSVQQQFYYFSAVLGVTLLATLFASIVSGIELVAGFTALLLTMGVFVIYRRFWEVNPLTGGTQPVYFRGQSYMFMAGPFLMVPMCMYASHAWYTHGDMLPSWVRGWQGFILAFVVLELAGVVFRWLDEPRYQKDARRLKSPTKWWVNHWQMPACIAVIAVMVLPTWWMPGTDKFWTIGFVVVLVLCGIADLFRELKPEDQHVVWNEIRFRPIILGPSRH